MPVQKIVPNLWFDGNAEEAGRFYAQAFARVRSASSEVASRYPDDVPDFQRPLVGEPLTVDLDIDGFAIVLINAGPEFRPNPSISFMLNFDPLFFDGDAQGARDRLDELWTALAEGGQTRMALGEYPFSARYGWVEDRYGVSWQLMLTNPEGDPRPFVIPSLMFGGSAQNRAREAADFYTSLFDESGLGTVVPYPAPTGPAEAGSVMFGEFRLAGQWFAMMDSGVEHDTSFSCGVSLEARCADQAEIDRLWEALSAHPDAEQCGWLADRFGVSWQIVPANMGELMQRPGAYSRMIGMTKLVIDEL